MKRKCTLKKVMKFGSIDGGYPQCIIDMSWMVMKACLAHFVYQGMQAFFFFFNYHFYCNQNYRNYMIGKKRQKKFNIEYRKRWKRWRIELGTCFPNHCTVQIKITFLSYLYKTSLNTCTPEANWLQSLIYCTHQSTKKKEIEKGIWM